MIATLDPFYFVYTTKTCAFCPMVKKFLTSKNIKFTVVELDDKPEIRETLFKETGAMTVPITRKVQAGIESYVVGWNPSLLNKLIGGE
jgi:glutaredoxin